MFLRLLTLVIYSPYLLYLKYSTTRLHEMHKALKNKIAGNLVYSTLIGLAAPYSASVRPTVNYFDNTKITCSIQESRSLKNPFNSIHALALANLGELTSGLLMMDYLKDTKQRGIVTNISADYSTKARGVIKACCDIDALDKDGVITSKLYDEKNTLVCTVRCTWTMKPIQNTSPSNVNADTNADKSRN